MQGRRANRKLASVIKGSTGTLSTKKIQRNGIVLPILTHGSGVWLWKRTLTEQAKIRAVDLT